MGKINSSEHLTLLNDAGCSEKLIMNGSTPALIGGRQ